jgi:hypothetical protein
MVATGVAVGAMVEMDCASVSNGDSALPRKPYPAAFAFFSASAIEEKLGGSLDGECTAMSYNTRAAVL